MAKLKYLRCALVAFAALGVFALTGFTNAGDASPTTAAEPTAGAAAPHAATPSAEPYRWQPRYPREDLPCNPPGTWEVYPSPTTKHLTAVDFIDVNNGWAVGDGVALRYSNGTWVEIPGHAAHVFEDLDMLTLTNGWAVGWNGLKDEPAIWRWNGSDWLEFQNPTGAISCIDMIDANHGWIGGNGYFLRFNGTTWEWGGSAPHVVFDIKMDSDTEGRAVGYQFIMRRTGNNWLIEVANTDWYLSSISMENNNLGWGSGQYTPTDKGLIVFYNGVWREFKIFENARFIPSLYVYSLDFGWCVGRKTSSPPYGSFIGFFDGNSWVEIGSPTNNGLNDIKIINENNAWIIGLYGTILKYKPNVGVIPTSVGRIKAIYR
jgi:hypothetical protein